MAENIPLESGNWNEPKTAYGKIKGKEIKGKKGKKSTLYPFNKVYESESGHVVEIDDTPGSERLHLFHRSGTFQELHPNGDSVTKIVRDNYTSILRDNYVHIDGHCNVTIDKALKILVNSDKKENSPSKSTNFDIEVGDNANINILVNKGNCQVRLKNGDANVLIDKGDVNIRQSAGNYNHFVNGDYNLEVTGHMHVVVGDNYVNEIGGSRDVRIDGKYDNLFITNGYSETTIPFGNLQYTVGKSKQEIINDSYYQKVLNSKISMVGLSEQKTIGGSYSVLASTISMVGQQGCGFGTDSSGLDIGGSGDVGMTSNKPVSITAPKINLTATEDINLRSERKLKLSANDSIDLYSSGDMKLTTQRNMNIFSTGNLLQTAERIHLNGPPAVQGTPADLGANGLSLVRPNELEKPSTPFEYTPGVLDEWKKTKNGTTPTNLIKNSIDTLKTQLSVLDDAANTTQGLREQTNGLINSVSQLESSPNLLNPSNLTNITTQTSNVATSALGVSSNLSTVTDTVSSSVQGVTDTVSSVSSSLTGGLSNVVADGGPLSGIKGAISSVTGFIGDIISTVADIACTIVDAIGSIVDALAKTITDAIKSVLSAINSVVDAIASIIQTITKLIADAIKQITDLIGSILDAAGDFIDGIVDSIASIFDGIGGRPIDCGKSLNAAQENSNLQTYSSALANGEITQEEYDRLVGNE